MSLLGVCLHPTRVPSCRLACACNPSAHSNAAQMRECVLLLLLARSGWLWLVLCAHGGACVWRFGLVFERGGLGLQAMCLIQLLVVWWGASVVAALVVGQGQHRLQLCSSRGKRVTSSAASWGCSLAFGAVAVAPCVCCLALAGVVESWWSHLGAAQQLRCCCKAPTVLMRRQAPAGGASCTRVHVLSVEREH